MFEFFIIQIILFVFGIGLYKISLTKELKEEIAIMKMKNGTIAKAVPPTRSIYTALISTRKDVVQKKEFEYVEYDEYSMAEKLSDVVSFVRFKKSSKVIKKLNKEYNEYIRWSIESKGISFDIPSYRGNSYCMYENGVKICRSFYSDINGRYLMIWEDVVKGDEDRKQRYVNIVSCMYKKIEEEKARIENMENARLLKRIDGK